MNIKRAKQEIKNTIRAYQLKNADGTYRIPSIRQRPVLLKFPDQIFDPDMFSLCFIVFAISVVYDHPSYETERHWSSIYPAKRIWWEDLFCNGIYHERDHCICL